MPLAAVRVLAVSGVVAAVRGAAVIGYCVQIIHALRLAFARGERAQVEALQREVDDEAQFAAEPFGWTESL